MTGEPSRAANHWNDIRQLLALRRKQLGLSQTEVARRIGVGNSVVSHWESGSKVPGLDNFLRWCTALEVDLGFAMTEERS